MYSGRDLQESRHHKAGNRALTGRRSIGRGAVRNRTLSRPLGFFTHVCIRGRHRPNPPDRSHKFGRKQELAKGRRIQIRPEGCLDCRLGPGHVDGELVDLTTAAFAVVAALCARRIDDAFPPADHSGGDLAGCAQLRVAHPARGHYSNAVVSPERLAKVTCHLITKVHLNVEGRPLQISEGVVVVP